MRKKESDNVKARNRAKAEAGGIRPEHEKVRSRRPVQILAVLRAMHRLMVHESDPVKLIERVCVTLSEKMGYRNAWIALLNDERDTVTALATSGFDCTLEPWRERLGRGDFPPCAARARGSDATVLMDDLQPESLSCSSAQVGYDHTELCRRLYHDGNNYGLVSVCLPTASAYNQEELELFDEMVDDLAFALHEIDLTKRLRECKQQFREIVEQPHIIFYRQNIKTERFEYISHGVQSVLGFTPAEVLGMGLAEQKALIHPDDLPGLMTFAADIIKAHNHGIKRSERKFRIRNKQGEYRWIRGNYSLAPDADGSLNIIVGTMQDITEQKKSDADLEFQAFILKNIYDLVIATDLAGCITYANEAESKLLSRPNHELLGKRVHILGEDPKQGVLQDEIMRRTLADGQWRGEVVNVAADGSKVLLDCRTQLLRNAGGSACGMVGISTDITERRQREHSIALMSRMLDEAPAAITIHDMAGRFVYANHRTLLLHGYEHMEELLAVNLHDLDIPESAELVSDRFRQIEQYGEACFEVFHFRKDGSIFPLEVTAKTVEWNGHPAVLSIAIDITERKTAERILQYSQMLLNTTEQLSGIGGWEWDVNKHTMSWTSGTYRIHELDPEAFLMGSPEHIQASLACYDPGCREKVQAAFQRCVECGEAYDLECNFTTAGKRKLWIRTIGRAVVESGRVVKVIGNIQDITERKRAAEERAKLQAELLQAQKMESVGRLAGGVAHDFNNMLGVILGYTEMALQEVNPGQALYADLSDIHKAARRSADLTRQLLAFARKQPITPIVIDLNEMVSSMLKMLDRLIGEDIELVWAPGKPLWSVKLDPSQIDQMLANLCLNARDAIVNVGRIVIETQNAKLDDAFCATHSGLIPGDYVLLSVHDSGCGMDEETLAHIYEPFFTTKEVGKGTGLGLATVYGIVKQNNGYIMAESKPGEGSNFNIYLPRHSEITEKCQDQEPGQRALQGHETVLLVEDEASILKMTTKMLEGLNYKVLAAATPTEAIRLAQSFSGPIHLLLADVVMPDMNGRDLANNVVSIRPDIRCLFMSGYKAEVISNQELSFGATRYLQKPFTLKVLAAKVREALT